MTLESSRITGDSSNNTEISTTSEADILTELQTSLDHLISDDRQASYQLNPTSGLIVLRAYPKTHRRVEAFLKQLSHSLHHQVLIEAKILEVVLGFLMETEAHVVVGTRVEKSELVLTVVVVN